MPALDWFVPECDPQYYIARLVAVCGLGPAMEKCRFAAATFLIVDSFGEASLRRMCPSSLGGSETHRLQKLLAEERFMNFRCSDGSRVALRSWGLEGLSWCEAALGLHSKQS